MKPTQEQIQAGVDAFYGSNKTGPLFAVQGMVELILEAALSASPAGVVKPWRLDKALAGYETVMDGSHEAILRFSSEEEFLFFMDAMSKGRIMSAIEPAGVGVETPSPQPNVVGRHPIETLWREVDLPEYFLGNDGSNHKLYALYDAIKDKVTVGLAEALLEVREAIMKADPDVLTDTLWMPENILKGATVVDRIDMALSPWANVKPQHWKERETFTFELDEEMIDRLDDLAERCEKQGLGSLASANYHGQGQVNVPAAWLRQLIAGYLPPPPQPRASVPAALKGDEQ